MEMLTVWLNNDAAIGHSFLQERIPGADDFFVVVDVFADRWVPVHIFLQILFLNFLQEKQAILQSFILLLKLLDCFLNKQVLARDLLAA